MASPVLKTAPIPAAGLFSSGRSVPLATSARRAPTESEIRAVAYDKWVAAGCPPNDWVTFWLAAELELKGQCTGGE